MSEDPKPSPELSEEEKKAELEKLAEPVAAEPNVGDDIGKDPGEPVKEPKIVLPPGLILQFQLSLQHAAEKGPYQFNVVSTNVKGKRVKLRVLVLEDIAEPAKKPEEVTQ